MPESLHSELAEAADREGVSLNQFITSALASIVDDGRERPDGTSTRRSRGLSLLLVANLVIVAAAGVAAILLLVSSWQG